MNSDKDYLSLPLGDFIEDAASRSPTPGGGSVAAVVGALAASLASMAIQYTVGKDKYAAHEPRLRELLDELKRAGDMFGMLMKEDMAAYERLIASRKADDIEEQQRASATAVTVPMEIVVLAGAVAARVDEIKTRVNPNLLSDLQAAAILAYAAARSASINVRANSEELEDQKEAVRLENQIDMLLGRTGRHRNAVVHYQPFQNL